MARSWHVGWLVLLLGCSTSSGLTRAERDVLRAYDASPVSVEEAARICLRHGLSRRQVLDLTHDANQRVAEPDAITFLFAPSQWWTLTFDEKGRALEAEITGRTITRRDVRCLEHR